MAWISEKLKTPFPYYLQDDRKNAQLVVVIGLFVTIFLFLFKTNQELELTVVQKLMFGFVTTACLFFNIIVLPKILPVILDSQHWNLGKYTLFNIWHLILIGAISAVIDKIYVCPEKTVGEVIIHAYTQVGLKGFIPIILITMFLRNRVLRQNLYQAIQTNAELGKIQTLKKEVSKSSNLITLHGDTSETITFNLPDLLYIEANDNYSTVFWKNHAGIEKKLLRANLKTLESQLNNTYTIRCHRSYIVNIHAIENIAGNANGYKIRIRDLGVVIPIARQKGKEVLEKISQIRNMMELT